MQSSRSADWGVVKPRAPCLCRPGSSSQPTVSSHTDGWVSFKFGCHDVWRMWFCAKHKTSSDSIKMKYCAAAEMLWPANVVHTCQKRPSPHVQVFSLRFDLFDTHLTSLQVTETELFKKLLSWWRNWKTVFSFAFWTETNTVFRTMMQTRACLSVFVAFLANVNLWCCRDPDCTLMEWMLCYLILYFGRQRWKRHRSSLLMTWSHESCVFSVVLCVFSCVVCCVRRSNARVDGDFFFSDPFPKNTHLQVDESWWWVE